jgi:hypothetical protein
MPSEPPTFAALNSDAATVGRRERLVHRSFSEGGSAPAPFDFAQGVVSGVEPRSGARPFGRLRVALGEVEGRESV